LAREGYQHLLDMMLMFMKVHGMQVDIETNPPPVEQTSRKPPPMSPRARVASWIALALWAVVAGVIGYLVAKGILRR
jgi:hypothetical protein